ncbi:hypothetical protein [Thiolapillus sp.]|uniref:hypothetical protein n=3 Tax=Thiolapillus sp. TaxID=2017437 RepID=UPI003AF5F238
MDSQTKTLIQLNAPQLLYLWRLAWLCQIAAYVQQQSTKPTTIEPKPLQEKKSPEQECIKEKPYVTVCCIKKKWSSVRRCTSSVPIFANGALSGAFGYLFNQLKGEWCLSASCHGTSYGELEFMPEEEQVDLANTVLLEAVTTVGTGGTIQVIRGVKALKSLRRIVSNIEEITTPGSKLRNFKTDVSISEFEKNLLGNGFAKSTSRDGVVNIFMKGNKKYTTRVFSNSTGGPTAEVFKSNRPISKIRLGDE